MDNDILKCSPTNKFTSRLVTLPGTGSPFHKDGSERLTDYTVFMVPVSCINFYIPVISGYMVRPSDVLLIEKSDSK